jgi:hypothetical protein
VRKGKAELPECWENRLPLNKLDTAERYVRGHICIILECQSGIGSGTINRESFAFAERPVGTVKFRERKPYATAFQNQVTNRRSVCNGRQSGVLVRIVKKVNSIKKFSLPAGKHFNRLKELIDRRVGGSYFATRFLITLAIQSVGEVEASILVVWSDKVPDQVV